MKHSLPEAENKRDGLQTLTRHNSTVAITDKKINRGRALNDQKYEIFSGS